MRWCSLHLHGATGLPPDRDGLRVDALGPGLNVVVGGNGAGKSTLATALRALTWAESAIAAQRGFDLAAVAEDADGRPCRATLRAAVVQWQGAEPVPPPAELARCLVLHGAELRSAGEAPEARLAQRVRLALAHGVDLDHAWQGTTIPARIGRREVSGLDAAQRQRRDAEQQLRDLAAQEAELPALVARQQRMAAAETSAGNLRRAAQAVEDLAEQVAERSTRSAQLVAVVAEESGELVWIAGTERVRGGQEIQQLRQGVRRLLEHEASLRDAARELREAQAREEDARQCLPGAAAPAPGPADLDRLAEWLDAGTRLQADQRQLVAEQQRAKAVVERRPAGSPRALRAGREALHGWCVALGDAAFAALLPWWLWLPVVGSAAAAVWAGTSLDPRWVALSAGTLVGGATLLVLRSRLRALARRREFVAAWRKLELAGPAAWRSSEVRDRIEALDADLAASHAADLAAAELADLLCQRQAELRARAIELHRQGAALLGGLDEADVGGHQPLTQAVMLRRLADWDAARAAVAVAGSKVRACRDDVRGRRAELQEAVAGWGGAATPIEGADWSEWVDELVELRGRVEQAATACSEAVEREIRQRRRVGQALAGAGVKTGLPEWTEPAGIDELEQLGAALRRDAEQADTEAVGLDELSRQIGAVEERIRAATAATHLADCLAAEEQAGDALRARRDEALRKTARAWLCARLEESLRQDEMPIVWRRAAGWLGRFTQRRLALELAAGGSASAQERARGGDDVLGGVRVVDSQTGQRSGLDEMSTGGQAQLLLALRLALATTAETGERWPMVLDEVLPTTDLERARAVAHALAEISSERQVLYFTFHEREVELLRAACAEVDGAPELRVLALEPGAPRQPVVLPAPPAPAPGPGDLDAPAYAALLDAAPPDPRSDSGALHVVHLWFDDLPAVQRLVTLGVTTLGAWRAHGGELPRVVEDAVATRLEARARVWEAVCLAWLQALGRRATAVDLDTLSDIYLPGALERLDHHGGDAGMLLAEMRDEDTRRQHYPRLQQKKVEELADQLRAAGCLGAGVVPDGAVLLQTVLRSASVGAAVTAGDLAEHDVTALLRYWSAIGRETHVGS